MRLTAFMRMRRITGHRSSQSNAVTGAAVMMSPTNTVAGSTSFATIETMMSRSVMMPTALGLSSCPSTTTRSPT